MNDFKFKCPRCGQHILANAEWIGRPLECPSCNTRITVPAPQPRPKKKESALADTKKPPGHALQTTLAQKVGEAQTTRTKTSDSARQEVGATEPGAPTTPGTVPLPSKDGSTVEALGAEPTNQKMPVVSSAPDARAKSPGTSARRSPQIEKKGELKKAVPQVVIPEGKSPPPSGGRQSAEALPEAARNESDVPVTPPTQQSVTVTEKPAFTPAETAEASPGACQPEPRCIAVLSAAVKLEIVRGVRQRIADESAWLPGKVDGKTAYAAKMDGANLVLLDAKSPEATRVSLMGAFLLELEAQHVKATATGRREFLDEEIPDGIRGVLQEQMEGEQGENPEDALADKDLLTISHAQCLAVLDWMEARYSERMEQLLIEKAKKRLGNVRLTDLVKKLEKKARIQAEDVATALYHELAEVRRRLERLESRNARDK